VILLGFDTATAATVVGLALADGTLLQARDDPQQGERPGHATRLLPLVDGLLVEAGLGWDQVERIAVGVGPGTFTGLRIGIATARALAQSLDVELVGVSSLDALPYSAGEHVQGETSRVEAASILAVIDARRGEVFVAAYEGEQQLLTPRAVSPDRVGELLEGISSDAGAEQWIALGNGAVLYRDAFERAGVSVPPDDSERHRIQSSAICGLGSRLSIHAQAQLSSDPSSSDLSSRPSGGPSGRARDGVEAIVPDYRRRPDAEAALEGVT
jgi:tRNA threonylcarbamoyladenosine biosynthesis protein TsaB